MASPAFAVSGLDDDVPGAVEAASDWVVRVALSDIVRRLKPGDYLTISLPPVAPSEVKGVRLVDRAPGLPRPQFKQIEDSKWQLVGIQAPEVATPPKSDLAVCKKGFIAVVPMRLDEFNRSQLKDWQHASVQFPPWKTPSQAHGH